MDLFSAVIVILIHRQSILAVLTVILISLVLDIVALVTALRDKTPDDGPYMGYSTVIFCVSHCRIDAVILCLSFAACCGCLRCCKIIPITTEDQNAIFLEQIMENAGKVRDGTPRNIEHQEPAVRVQPVD